MVARVISFQLQAGKFDEMIHVAIVPVILLMQQHPGCKLVTLLGAHATNKVLALVFGRAGSICRTIGAGALERRGAPSPGRAGCVC